MFEATPEQLKETRLALGLSQAELADILGVASNTVAVWERGDQAIQHPRILALALTELGRRRHKGTRARRARHKLSPTEPNNKEDTKGEHAKEWIPLPLPKAGPLRSAIEDSLKAGWRPNKPL